jgi:MFS family permease
LRPEPFYLGIAFAALGLGLSTLLVKDTRPFVQTESRQHSSDVIPPSLASAFARSTWGDSRLIGISQAGFVNNLNDALAWGIFPLYFAAHGLDLQEIGLLAAAYPLVWAFMQLGTGWLSDRRGRKSLIVYGMAIQAAAIAMVVAADEFALWFAAVALLGLGTAMVYPTLLAAIGDSVHPAERATTMGVYRFWRDIGAMAGAIVAGITADALNLDVAILVIAAATALSSIVARWLIVEHPIVVSHRPPEGATP